MLDSFLCKAWGEVVTSLVMADVYVYECKDFSLFLHVKKEKKNKERKEKWNEFTFSFLFVFFVLCLYKP